jgi:hypothetical protein
VKEAPQSKEKVNPCVFISEVGGHHHAPGARPRVGRLARQRGELQHSHSHLVFRFCNKG